MKLYQIALLIVVLFLPDQAHAGIACEDVGLILDTETNINNLYKKYRVQLNKHTAVKEQGKFYSLYIEDEFDSIYTCILLDGSLVDKYIQFALSHDNSADEAIPGYLGLLYLNMKNVLLDEIAKYQPEQIDYLIDSILYGVGNYKSTSNDAVDISAIAKELANFKAQYVRSATN